MENHNTLWHLTAPAPSGHSSMAYGTLRPRTPGKWQATLATSPGHRENLAAQPHGREHPPRSHQGSHTQSRTLEAQTAGGHQLHWKPRPLAAIEHTGSPDRWRPLSTMGHATTPATDGDQEITKNDGRWTEADGTKDNQKTPDTVDETQTLALNTATNATFRGGH